MNIAIWHHEREDHANWERFCGERVDYEGFLRRLDIACKEAVKRGHDVYLVDITVAEMERLLKHLKLENTPDNRAFVSATMVSEQPKSDKVRRYSKGLEKDVFES